MKHWSRIFTILFFFSITISCSNKIVRSDASELVRQPPIESKVLSLKRVGIADTTIAFISGLVQGKDSINNKITIEGLPYSSIAFSNQLTKKKIYAFTNYEGKFNQYLSAGTYNINVSSVCYNELKIENVSLGTGEIKELNVLLGFISAFH